MDFNYVINGILVLIDLYEKIKFYSYSDYYKKKDSLNCLTANFSGDNHYNAALYSNFKRS